MSWADYLLWALIVVCVIGLVVCMLGNFACSCLFGAADDVPQPTRRGDMRLVADQTRCIQDTAFDKSVRKSTERRAALVKQQREAVRLQGLAAALHDAAHGSRTPCAYTPGSPSAHLWQATYQRAAADCAATAEKAAA